MSIDLIKEYTGDQEVLTIPEIAQWLRVSSSTVYRMVNRGELEGVAFKVGRDWRFRRPNIVFWLHARENLPWQHSGKGRPQG